MKTKQTEKKKKENLSMVHLKQEKNFKIKQKQKKTH